jgi:hypothetical protein
METQPSTAIVKDHVLRTRSDVHHLLLAQLTVSKRVHATIPGRSRRKITVQCTDQELRSLLSEAAKLYLIYERQRLTMLIELLRTNKLPVPFSLEMAMVMEEVKDALIDAKHLSSCVAAPKVQIQSPPGGQGVDKA